MASGKKISPAPSNLALWLSGIVISVLLILAAILFNRAVRKEILEEKYQELQGLAYLKSQQLTDWYRERYADTRQLTESPIFVNAVAYWINTGDKEVGEDILERLTILRQMKGYSNAYILSPTRKIILGLDPTDEQHDSLINTFIDSVLLKREIVFTDFYLSQEGGEIHFDILGPLIDDNDRLIAIILLNRNPENYLYPLLLSSPISSESFETMLVRQEGDSVIILNDLRFLPASALNYRLSMGRDECVSVMAVKGEEGTVLGKDYRGERVVADIRFIPGTRWHLITKIDGQEIFADVQTRTYVVFGILFCLLILTIVTISWIYRYRQKRVYEEMYRHERSLREVQEEFRITLFSIGDAVITTDRKGIVRHMNLAASGLTGWEERDAVGLPVEKVFRAIDEDHRQKIENPVVRVLREGLVKGLSNHTILISRDGTEVPISDSGAPIRNDEGEITGVVLVFKDQTRERFTRRSLLRSEERYRSLFENTHTIMLIIDPDTACIVDANSAACAFYGYSREEMRKLMIWDINTLTPAECRLRITEISKAGSGRLLHKHRLRDGTLRDMEIFTGPINLDGNKFLYSIVHDITERKASEEKIKKLSEAVENSPVAIMITDRNGIIEYTNPKFRQMTGYSQKELAGNKPFLLKSGKTKPELYRHLWDTILAGRQWQGEMENKKKSGELYWEQLFISPVKNETGVITHFVALRQDITRDKELREELIRAKEKAEEGDRLKTAFLHNISHEIRTPVNAIVGFSGLLGEAAGDEVKVKQYTDVICQSSDQLLSIITDIISMATIEAGQVVIRDKEISMNTVLRHLYNQYHLAARQKGISFTMKTGLKDGEDRIVTDEIKFLQIISNLLNNALKFTREGHVKFGYTAGKNTVEFYVEDTGIGIPEQYREAIFDRFRQVENSSSRNYGGTGLGLSIARSYATLLGGEIRLSSLPGKGSVFTFILPLARPEVQEDAEMPGGPEKVRQKEISALVVEDEFTNFLLIETLLKKQNIAVLHAENGEEALRACSDHPEIALVLMDIKMPLMDGLEATRAIKKIRPGLPIVAVTAFARPDYESQALANGCSAYLTKPVDQEKLLDLLQQILFPS